MIQKSVISLCDKSARMVQPWADAGYLCYCIDTQHPPGSPRHGNIILLDTDIRTFSFYPENLCMIFAFPPCTHLSVSGARWMKKKGLRALSEAIDIFGACVNYIENTSIPGFCENPVSTISTYYRKPDFVFDPYEYGDPYTKKTCIWAFNGFTMPPKTPVEPTEGSKMYFIGPGRERMNKRSITPAGFADAVFRYYHDG